MITKVTSDNRTLYMDLFDKASQALEGTAIYDLDSYFRHLETLVAKNRSFLKLPLDEPYFEIVDGGNAGRRVINIPIDFQRNGISVQGDESAEIVYFSIDRYYDSFDLMGPSKADIEDVTDPKMPLRIVIQWETPSAKGVSLALVDEDGRPFLADDGKLFFGWPISSEITQVSGNVKFNVRFYQFSGENDETGKPILAFGMNTQTTTVKINAAINYDITGQRDYRTDRELAVFEENGTEIETILGRNELVLSRIQNSTKYNIEETEESPLPMFLKNLPTAEPTITVTHLTTNDQNEEVEVVEEFSYIDLVDGSLPLQVLAVPSEGAGFISYGGRRKERPDGNYYNMGADNSPQDYETLYKKVGEFTAEDIDEAASITLEQLQTTRVEGLRYYLPNELGIMSPVTNLPVAGEAWRHDELNNDFEEAVGEEAATVKYYIALSNRYLATRPGYYFISARNSDGSKLTSALESNKIYVPYPTGLEAENVVGGSNDVEAPAAAFLDAEGAFNLDIEVTEVEGDTVVYTWKHGDAILSEATAATYTSTVEEADRALYDEAFSVACYTTRNNANTQEDNTITRFFRVTKVPTNFAFIVDEPQSPSERMMSGVRERTVVGDNNEMPTIAVDFTGNGMNNAGTAFNFKCDAIKYKWFLADTEEVVVEDETIRELVGDEIYTNDTPMQEDYTIVSVIDNTIPTIAYTPTQPGDYYCEVINIVNGMESDVARTEYIYARA